MKPSDAELKDLLQSAQWIDLKEDSHGVELSMRQAETAMQLAKAELQRRQQPASVPAELLRIPEWMECEYKAVNAEQFSPLEILIYNNEPSDAYSVTRFRAEVSAVVADIANRAYAYGREQSQWVPVSERLPDDDAKVIYSSPHVGVRQGRYIADDCEFSSRGFLLHYSDVTHWMPLPEPPTC